MKTKRLTLLALCAACAMILSYVESLLPPLSAIPGIRLGLANIAVVFALYTLGGGAAAAVSLTRIVVTGLLFGSGASILYSLAGGVLSLTGMLLLKKSRFFSVTAVSVSGGVLHNVGQILAAWLIMGTAAVGYYLPFLIFSGVLAGICIGLLAAFLIRRIRL